jgi:galactokinase
LPAPLDRRVRHVVTENARTRAGMDAMKRSHWQGLGRLMTGSHLSLRDDFEVSCAELDHAVKTALEIKGVLGARMTGGGFGGSAILLVKDSVVDAACDGVRSKFAEKFGSEPDLYVTEASAGMRSESPSSSAEVTIQNGFGGGAEAGDHEASA